MKNWKTTVIGIVGALFIAVGGVMTDGTLTIAEITTAVTTALLGVFAKDFNVTGGDAK